jgi:hypothetical protein
MAVWTTYIIALSDIAGKNNHSRNVRRQSSPVSSTNKTDRHDITEILLKVTLNTITPNTNPICG